jgi:hypothetical protein
MRLMLYCVWRVMDRLSARQSVGEFSLAQTLYDLRCGANRRLFCKTRHPALPATCLLSRAGAWPGDGHFLQIEA